MKKKVAIELTDLHLSRNNISEVWDTIKQTKSIIKEHKINYLFLLGDIFDSRKAQPLKVLNTFKEIIEFFTNDGIQIYCIPGNHDKVDYESEESYLDVYASYENFYLYRSCGNCTDNNWGSFTVHFVPYFDEKTTYSKYLNNAIKNIVIGHTNILLTHIGIDGVLNNDKETVSGVSRELFEKFDAVHIGHYHDRIEVGDNIWYIGADRQKNYAEDEEKGVCLLYNDASHDQIKLESPRYKVININLDKTHSDELQKLYEEYANNDDFIRFKLTGSKEKLFAFDKHKYKSVGIDIYSPVRGDQVTVTDAEVDFQALDKAQLKKEFNDWVKDTGKKNVKIGREYLEHRLKENESI